MEVISLSGKPSTTRVPTHKSLIDIFDRIRTEKRVVRCSAQYEFPKLRIRKKKFQWDSFLFQWDGASFVYDRAIPSLRLNFFRKFLFLVRIRKRISRLSGYVSRKKGLSNSRRRV